MSAPESGREGRRAFFRALLGGSRECGFAPRYSLSELPDLPAPQLAGLIPSLLPSVEIILESERALARVPEQPNPVFLFQMNQAALSIFNRFDGRRSLGAIAVAVCDESSKPPEVVFAEVRAMFLRLVALGVCAPANAPPRAISPPRAEATP